jgi:hypothetical protein
VHSSAPRIPRARCRRAAPSELAGASRVRKPRERGLRRGDERHGPDVRGHGCGERRAPIKIALLLTRFFLVAPIAVSAHGPAVPLALWGSVQVQNIVRHPSIDEFQFIQQRNTVRLGAHWDPVRPEVPDERTGISAASFRLLYRGAYDSIYDYVPIFRERDLRGRKPGRAAARDLRDLPRRARDAIKRESRLREAFVDLRLRAAPVRLRLGLQQIVWGEADLFRMLDRTNPLDTTWHFVEEIPPPSFGWDDLRIPLWILAGEWNLGDLGPFSSVHYRMYWNPGDWRPVKVAFLPRPWGIRLLDPLTNREDGAFFAPFSGIRRLAHSSLFKQGDYRRTPAENSQIGVQISWAFAGGTRMAGYYFHQRWAGDDGTPVAFLRGVPDTPRGRIRTQDLLRRGTLPVEYIAPYVHTVGLSMSHYLRATGTTLRLETVYDFGLPLFDRDRATTLSPYLPGLAKHDYWKGMLAFDRPFVLGVINRDAATFVTGQWFVHHLMHNDDSLTGPLDLPTAGARSHPFCGSAPGTPCTDPSGNGSFRDDVRSWESLVTVAAFTTYRAGALVPVIGVVLDPINSYSMNPFWNLAVAVSAGLSVDLTQHYFVSAQRDVQKGPFNPWLFGTMRGRSETAVRLTYRF